MKAAHAQVEQLTGVKPTEQFVDRGFIAARSIIPQTRRSIFQVAD